MIISSKINWLILISQSFVEFNIFLEWSLKQPTCYMDKCFLPEFTDEISYIGFYSQLWWLTLNDLQELFFSLLATNSTIEKHFYSVQQQKCSIAKTIHQSKIMVSWSELLIRTFFMIPRIDSNICQLLLDKEVKFCASYFDKTPQAEGICSICFTKRDHPV